MTDDLLELKIWGSRGSLPHAATACSRFGGNTICFELRCGEHVLLFDAGSGLPTAGKSLLAEGKRDFHLFFSHCHYDHIMGLPFFLPLYKPEASVTFWAGHIGEGTTTQAMIADFMRRPFFPVGPEVFKANVAFNTFDPGDSLNAIDGIRIMTRRLSHPGGAVGYRIEYKGKSVAMVFDTDHVPGELDPVILELIRGVDLFLYDASFTDDEFECFRHFGHSTWQQGVRLAIAAGAKRTCFIHHAIFRTDAELEAIEVEARAMFAGASCGRDLQVFKL